MHKRSFVLKRLLFARKCERTFEGVPIYMGEEVEGTIYRKNNLSLAYAPHNATVPSEGTRLRGVPKVLSASFPRSLQQVPKGAQRMMKGCSKVGPKGCSKDDERVLKGCLCLCHPSHNLFFCRKLLHGTILFPKFSAKVILFFDICKFCTTVLSTFYIFYLIFRTLRPLARNTISVK